MIMMPWYGHNGTPWRRYRIGPFQVVHGGDVPRPGEVGCVCEYSYTEYLCCDSAFAHKKEFYIFKFPERFLEISWTEISLLSLLLTSLDLSTQSKFPKNQLPTSFGLCYDDHLQSSVINSFNLSDPTTLNSQFIRPMTLKTPSGDYETRNFTRDDFI